ncbi:MAG: type II toxin-antitoxin system PemK/MazF family toxin [Acidobacteria bacterium]|nr:type II toxin-antitoxin system PemK/MazF family toxin [Acidobacteriota bacterium]MBI3657283.1 type II toxin-antitoxin system PemK/MazF family toxin [Acidobacteriota bacterium]
MAKYVPQKGDFITLSFDTQSGHEQRGRRPALVISNCLFNEHTRLAIVCPVTNTNRNIPFHLATPASSSLSGFVMVDQVKSVDYVARKAKFIEKAPDELVTDVLEVLDVCTK